MEVIGQAASAAQPCSMWRSASGLGVIMFTGYTMGSDRTLDPHSRSPKPKRANSLAKFVSSTTAGSDAKHRAEIPVEVPPP